MMTILDDKGRLLGRLNLVDLLAVGALCVLVAVAYARLSAPHRAVPVFPEAGSEHWTAAELVLPAELAFLAESAQRGGQALDARSGAPMAEVLGAEMAEGGAVRVRVRLRAYKDGAGRLIYDGSPLVAGRRLRIETASAVYEGAVRLLEP